MQHSVVFYDGLRLAGEPDRTMAVDDATGFTP